MPTYEYECTQCMYRFEVFQQMSEKPLRRCPKCKHTVKRLISTGSGVIFKGSGFYATDYRKPAPPERKTPKTQTCPKTKEACDGCPKAERSSE